MNANADEWEEPNASSPETASELARENKWQLEFLWALGFLWKLMFVWKPVKMNGENEGL